MTNTIPHLTSSQPLTPERYECIMPSSSSMQLEILSFGGNLLTLVSAEPSWRCMEVLEMLRQTGILAPGAQAQIFHGHSQLTNSARLADFGVKNGSQLTLVRSPSCILTTSMDCTAKLWNPERGDCVRTFKGHYAPIVSAVFSPDAQKLLTVSWDDTARLWCVASGECSFTLKPSSVGVRIAKFSPDGQQVLTAGGMTMMSLWSSVSGEQMRTVGGTGVKIASFSPDGQQLLEVSCDRTPRLWCAASGECLASFSGHVGRINSAIFSPDEQSLLTASEDTTAKLWSVESRKCVRTFDAHADNVISANFSEDGKQLLTADCSFIIKVWSITSDQCYLTIESPEKWLSLRSAAFCSHSQRVLTTSVEGKTGVWCTETGKCLFTFEDHTGDVIAAAFISNGEQVLTATSDMTTKLWSAVSGKCLLTFEGHNDSVTSVSVTLKTDAIDTSKTTDTAEEPPCKRKKSTLSSSSCNAWL